ncbi:MAG: hypothetical protein ABL999_02335 [Pyrinomonadaceae bacterium]
MSKTVFLVICLAITVFVLPAAAQTTIFNIPSADTQSKGSWGIEADFITKPVSYREGGYQTYGYRVSYGLGNKTELGTNFYLTKGLGDSTGQAEFSLKQNIYRNEKLGVSVSGGTVVFVPVRSTSGDKTAIMVYGNASKTIEPLNGLTVTGGVYHVFRGNNFGTKTGVMAAAVQPIAKKFSFVADWYSGKNRLGYSSAGINYQISTRQYILSGYSFGNSGRGNNAFAAYYGYTF